MAPRKRTTTAAEPEVPTVAVEWIRTTSDAASEHGCRIADRRYHGRAGEQVQMRTDDAQILAGGGFVKYLPEPEPEQVV